MMSMSYTQTRRLIVLAILLLFCLPLAAQNFTIEYVEGWVDVKHPNGQTVEAMIGDQLQKDDTVVTGDDGTATLTREGAAEIVISPNSVFSIREIDSGGEKETVMHTALGSVKFKFLRLFGREPKISTPSTVAGVRGTEFTVYSGDEGSALFTVDSGEVMVTSQGIPVVLLENEGVEVKAGQAPGQKFVKQGRPIDYSAWVQEKQSEFSADPIAGLRGIERQMDEYIREVENLKIMSDEQEAIVKQARNELEQIKKEKGAEAGQQFLEQSVFPETQLASDIYHNLRYYTINAFSLKRYVLNKQYSILKAKNLLDSQNETVNESIAIIQKIEMNFYTAIGQFLIEYDF